MADIKQAGKWMKEGKCVIGGNAMWPLLMRDDEIFFTPQKGENYSYRLDVNDLLADNWRVAE